MTPPSLASLQVATAALLNAGLAATVGALASSAWLRRGRSPWAMRAGPVLWHTLQAALVVTLLASLGVLGLQAAVMAEVPLREALPAVGLVLAQSHYGAAWRIGAAGLGVALIAAGWPRRSGAVVAAGVVAFACSRSLVGHAGSHGDATWGVVLDAGHLLLTSLWAGEVVVGAFVLSAACDDGDRQERARWIEALSATATWALAGIVATGSVNAWQVAAASPGPIVGSGYATALLVKLALVGIAVALGGFNRFLVMPRLLPALRGESASAGPLLRRFVTVLRIEAVVLAAVLVAAAVLAATAPPGTA